MAKLLGKDKFSFQDLEEYRETFEDYGEFPKPN